MSLKYPSAKGGFVKFHPPPKGRIYGNVAKQFQELRGSWIFKHPPPLIIYERRKLYRQTT